MSPARLIPLVLALASCSESKPLLPHTAHEWWTHEENPGPGVRMVSRPTRRLGLFVIAKFREVMDQTHNPTNKGKELQLPGGLGLEVAFDHSSGRAVSVGRILRDDEILVRRFPEFKFHSVLTVIVLSENRVLHTLDVYPKCSPKATECIADGVTAIQFCRQSALFYSWNTPNGPWYKEFDTTHIEGGVRKLDLNTGNCEEVFRFLDAYVSGMRVSPDAKLLWIIKQPRERYKVVENGREGIRKRDWQEAWLYGIEQKQWVRIEGDFYASGTFTPDGEWIVSVRKDAVVELVSCKDPSVRKAVAFGVSGRYAPLSPDGKWLCYGRNGQVLLRDMKTGDIREILQRRGGWGEVGRLVWSEDSTVVGGYISKPIGYDLFVFDLTSDELVFMPGYSTETPEFAIITDQDLIRRVMDER